jgi:predicted enzyme related to lactoylglutathione lyase
MLSLNSLLLSSEVPKKLVDFYRQVLAREPKWQEGEYSGFEVGACALVIGPHSKVQGQTKNPERIMFNFETSDVKGEFERMKGLGAKVIAQPYHMGDDQDFLIATLADPERNYFQLVSPMKG